MSRSNGRLLAIGTIRSDYLDAYEQHPESLKPPFLELYRLPPFPWERVTEVIVKPAERVDVTFTEDLITRLKGDAPTSDALPLLAFTLEKLFRGCASDKLIELREYEQLGGMTGSHHPSGGSHPAQEHVEGNGARVATELRESPRPGERKRRIRPPPRPLVAASRRR